MISITKLISIDSSSSKTGWALFENGNYVTSGILDFHKEKDTEKRIRDMCTELLGLLEDNGPNIIVIEKLNVSRNMQTTRVLAMIIGTVYSYSITHNNVFYFEIQASQWRKQLGIYARSRKREEYKKLAIQYIQDNLGITVPDDEADAICIGFGYIKMWSRDPK